MNWFLEAASRKEAPVWWRAPAAWFVWAVFGNADDGVFGQEPHVPLTPGRFNWAWWRRNPFHNLCFHTLATGPHDTSWALWPLPDEHLKAQWHPAPLLSFRHFGWEGYAGWRPKGLPDGRTKGVFGFAFRRD